MSSPLRLLSLTVLAAALACVSASAWAQKQDRGGRRDQQRQDQDAPRTRNDEALSDAVRRIERSNRGQVLSAERMQSDGREVNRIKIVDDTGRVRIYTDDPEQSREPPTRDDDD